MTKIKKNMTAAQAITKIFEGKANSDYSKIWKKVYDPYLSAITGKVFVDPTVLDEEIKKEYGEYEGSLGDYIISRWGEEVLEAIKN
jgi:hypothetical protein